MKRQLSMTMKPATVVLLAWSIACSDDTGMPAAPDSEPAVAAAASALVLRQVSAGGVHSCGVTTDDIGYCWGQNNQGQLGTGWAQYADTTPQAVQGELRFRRIEAGDYHTCGVTIEDDAYCWGGNGSGQVGNGTTGEEGVPALVAGGLKFLQVSPGAWHTCGLTKDYRAYCWGANSRAQLGDRTTTQRLTPVPVAGTLRFRQVSAGGEHTCAVAEDGRAYCWGWNRFGQVGDSTEAGRRYRPRLVAGGHLFRHVSAGSGHTCGVTKADRAYCWGFGRTGELGNGKAYLSFWPRRVAGGLSFRSVSAGDEAHTCGIASDGRAYCWGYNAFGQLGNRSFDTALTPVRVAGGIPFDRISAGRLHTEALAGTVGYHWGLVDGEGTSHPVPVPSPE